MRFIDIYVYMRIYFFSEKFYNQNILHLMFTLKMRKFFLISIISTLSCLVHAESISVRELAQKVGLPQTISQRGYKAMDVVGKFKELYNRYDANTLNKHFAHYIAFGKLDKNNVLGVSSMPTNASRYIPPVSDNLVSKRRANLAQTETIAKTMIKAASKTYGRQGVRAVSDYLSDLYHNIAATHALKGHIRGAMILARYNEEVVYYKITKQTGSATIDLIKKAVRGVNILDVDNVANQYRQHYLNLKFSPATLYRHMRNNAEHNKKMFISNLKNSELGGGFLQHLNEIMDSYDKNKKYLKESDKQAFLNTLYPDLKRIYDAYEETKDEFKKIDLASEGKRLILALVTRTFNDRLTEDLNRKTEELRQKKNQSHNTEPRINNDTATQADFKLFGFSDYTPPSGSGMFSRLGSGKKPSYTSMKKAYIQKALALHPDKTQGNPQKEAEFKVISAAWGRIEKLYQN